MTRKALMPNRQDYWLRRPQHDLDAIPEISSLWNPGGDPCDPCGDCKRGGAITDCVHCRQATMLYTFRHPEVSPLITGSGTPTLTEYTVEWATACLWEGDNIPVACTAGTDQFGWSIEISGRNPGDVGLTCSRRSGANCAEVSFTYRNFYPLKCLCPMLMFLDPESLVGIQADDLPCSVCVEPTYNHCPHYFETCECPANWRLTIGASVIDTNSGTLVSLPPISFTNCFWWTTSPTNGLYTLLYSANGAIGPPLPGVSSIDVFQFDFIEPSIAFTPIYGTPLPPFYSGTPLAFTHPPVNQWRIAQSAAVQSCGISCVDGQTLDRTTGSGPATILVEHLNG